MSKPFQFKKFTVNQDRTAMKIGTDGVLLAAWTDVSLNPSSVLDIGAGTGVIALMLAQRSSAETIDAIEIEENAYEQCVENFENSPWADSLFCYHCSLDEFVLEIEDSYDLIVSNPPFYTNSLGSGNVARDRARSNIDLPFEELFNSITRLLSKNGLFAMIAPFNEEESLIKLAMECRLYPKRITRVKGLAHLPAKRSLMEFTFENSEAILDELIIEKGRHQYTEKYIELTKDFYLNM